MRRASEQKVSAFVLVGCILAATMILTIVGCRDAHAVQEYNAFTGEYETVPDDGRDWSARYNAHDGSYSVQPEDAETEYNPYNGQYEWNSGHNPRRRSWRTS